MAKRANRPRVKAAAASRPKPAAAVNLVQLRFEAFRMVKAEAGSLSHAFELAEQVTQYVTTGALPPSTAEPGFGDENPIKQD